MPGLTRDVVIRLLGESASAVKAQKAAADAAGVSVAQYRKAEREMARMTAAQEKSLTAQRAAAESTGRSMMLFGAVTAVGLGLAAKAAMDWETAWAGVTKVVDGSGSEMAQLESDLRNLATTLPATHEEIAGVAEAAGQLGIKRGDIVEFTKVAIAMGVSTNLAAEDAATGMARFSNIMGTSSKDVDRLGSTIVALGNEGASTEAEILAMGLRIAAAGRQAGMSESDVLGLANAMSSLGIEAEAGGTAISMVIKDINSAVLDGGDQLHKYAQIAGMTAADFSKAWKTDAAGALQTVVAGLGRLQASGANVNATISDLGLDGIRVSDTLLRLSGNASLLSGSLATGNRAWAENNALMNEANKRYETTASKLQIARNQISDAAIDIGQVLLPLLAGGASIVADLARGFAELPGPVKEIVTVLGLLALTVGLVGGAALIAVPKLIAFRAEMTTLAASSGAATSAVGKFGLFMTGPWGAAIGAATLLLGGLVTWLGKSSKASAEAQDFQHQLAAALRESGGAIDENIRHMAAQKAEDSKFQKSSLLEWAERMGVAGSKVTDALLGNKSAYEEITKAIDVYAQAQLDAAIANGTADTVDLSWVPALKKQYADLAGGMGGAVAENERLANAEKKTGAAADGTTSSMDSLAGVTGDVADASGQAASAAEKLADLLDALNGPTLDMRQATRDYKDQLDEIAKAMGEDGWTKTLDENTESGRKNAGMLDDLAKKAMDQANAIVANGGSYDAFRNSLNASRDALIKTAISMGATDEQAKALADQILQIPDAAEINVEVPTYQQTTDQLVEIQKKIANLPPQTWTNVGVISQDAISKLEAVGLKTRTLPDGTVEVYADKGKVATVEQQLDQLVRTRTAIIAATVQANVQYNTANSRDGFGGKREHGGPVGFAVGGGPSAGQLALVGERGPELVRFGGRGYVTPADLTAHAIGQSNAALAALRPETAPTTVINRTFAPVFHMTAARPVTAREAMDVARDYEWLHGG